MKKNKGWVKVYRDLMDNDLWKDKPFARGQAWVDLIMLANHKDKEFLFDSTFLNVTPGEIVTSKRKLGERWGWSRTKVSRFLDELESVQMITQNCDAKKTIIKLLNYEKYQGIANNSNNREETINVTPKSHSKATERPLKDTNKNVKNIKNVKNVKESVGTAPARELTDEELRALGYE